MTTDLKLYELTGSPNNVKVRIALGYKGLDYERIPVDLADFPGDRSKLVGLTRQPRMPVLTHGETRIFDSGAILRYLEANFPDTPPLFTEDYQTFGDIERWEVFGRTRLGEPLGMLFGQAFNPQPDADAIARANELLDEALGVFEDQLSGRDYLVGDHLTAADIACASPLYLADQTEESAASSPIASFFSRNMKIAENRTQTLAWVRRVMAHDPIKGRS